VWSADETEDLRWKRIDVPDAKLLAYQHAHEQAVSMGYASLTEALEALESMPTPNDDLRERAAMAAFKALLETGDWTPAECARMAWEAADAFIVAKGRSDE
jgi:hypothetical protein